MNKSQISVCIIAKNEGERLAGCLDSVIGIAGEIVLVDTGSTDNTIEVALKYCCKIIKSDWRDDFSYSRNISIQNASLPYILIIDADERLIDGDTLTQITRAHNSTVAGWLINVESVATTPTGQKEFFASNVLRFFKNLPNIKFEGIIHEQVVYSITALGYAVENTNVKIEHIGYDLSDFAMKAKQERNLKLLNRSLSQSPEDSYNIIQRAKTLQALDRHKEAQADFRKALGLLPADSQMKTRAYNYGAINLIRLGDKEMALQWAAESVKLIPNQAFANFILGELYFEKKDFGRALEAYEKMRIAQTAGDVSAQVAGDYRIPEEILAYKIGRCCLQLNDNQRAADEFSTGFKANMTDVSNIVGMANVAFKMKKTEEARNLLQTALKIDPTKNEIYAFLKEIDRTEKTLTKEILDIKREDTAPISDTQTLAVCMIVKNEGHHLHGCLSSVKLYADEIIIVDTGSTDNTVELAKSFGAKVYYFDWIGDFSAARNESLSKCTADWILYLDADERLKAESGEYIKNYINLAADDVGALLCTIESPHAQLDGSAEMHRGVYPRLFRNYGYPKIKFLGRVHEQISPSIVDLNKTVAFSDIIIEHLGYNQSRPIMEEKIKRNYQMLLAHVQDEPLNGYAWYQLGQTLAQMSLFEQAEESIRFSIQCGNLSDTIYASATATLSQMTGNKKNFPESLHWAEESLGKSPDQIYSCSLKGFSLLNLGKPQEALFYFEKAINLKKSLGGIPRTGFDIEVSDDILQQGIAAAKRALGK